MSEETDKVGNSGEGDSQSSSGSQQSPDLATIVRDEIAKQLKGFQKGTDKVNARVEQRVNETLSGLNLGRIAELVKAGKSSEEIENQLLLDELLAERKGKASGSGAGGNGKDSSGDAEGANVLSQLVSAFGLDANDKAVAEALSKGDLNGLAAVAKSKLQAPEADSTTQPPITSKESRGEDANQKALKTAYDKAVQDAQVAANGRRIPPHVLADIKSEYRKKGLQIY